MNIHYYRNESGFSINPALVFKTQVLRTFLHKEAARQGSFCSGSTCQLWSYLQGMFPEPHGEALTTVGSLFQADGKFRSHQLCKEDWLPCVHSHLASVPTFQLPFLWIKEVTFCCSPNCTLGRFGKKGVVSLPGKWVGRQCPGRTGAGQPVA